MFDIKITHESTELLLFIDFKRSVACFVTTNLSLQVVDIKITQ